MKTPSLPRELAEPLEAFCQGELTEDLARQLEALVMNDPANRKHFVRFMMMHAAIMRQETNRSGSLRSSLPAAEIQRDEVVLAEVTKVTKATDLHLTRAALREKAWRRSLARARAVAAVLFVAYFASISWNILAKRRAAENNVVAASGEDRGSPTDGQPVAQITASEDAQWRTPEAACAADLQSAIRNQQSKIIPSEPLALTSGTVELTLKQGVKLLIHGPAQWRIQGSNKAELTSGKLYAYVPPEAVGFTVTTPQVTVTDLGTEFGVEADNNGETEVHVFRGVVDLQHLNNRGNLGAAIRLHAGEARLVRLPPLAAEPLVTTIAAAPQKFLPAKAFSGQLAWTDRWQAHRNALVSDRRLVALYDFESRGKSLSSHLAGKLPGRIESIRNPSWVAGRVREKSALAFGEQFAQVVVEDAPELRLDEVTLMVSLRLDIAPKEPTLIVGKGIAPARNYCLWVQPGDGAHNDKPYFQWNLFTEDGRNPVISAGLSIELGTWYCVTGVAAKDRYVLYVNGEEAARGEPLNSSLATSNDPLRIGLSPFDCPGRLTAVIDEVAIFAGALSAEEIKAIAHPRKEER